VSQLFFCVQVLLEHRQGQLKKAQSLKAEMTAVDAQLIVLHAQRKRAREQLDAIQYHLQESVNITKRLKDTL